MKSTSSRSAIVRLSVAVASVLLVGCIPLRNRQVPAKERAWDAAVEQYTKHNAHRFLVQWRAKSSWNAIRREWIVRIDFLSHGGCYIAHIDPNQFCVVAETFINKNARRVSSLEDALGVSEPDLKR